MKERIRTCIAVFNSSYFSEKLVFPSNVSKINGSCELKTISFQTAYGKKEATGESFKEWMLSCEYDTRSENRFQYLLSVTRQRDEIFVYFWDHDTGKVFLENFSYNLRFFDV